jgi:hypothetical protein
VASLHGRLRVAVAGFVAGGHAALDAIAANQFDPFADPARPSKIGVARNLAATLWGAAREGSAVRRSTAGAKP